MKMRKVLLPILLFVPLLAFSGTDNSVAAAKKAAEFLCSQQNPDGTFGKAKHAPQTVARMSASEMRDHEQNAGSQAHRSIPDIAALIRATIPSLQSPHPGTPLFRSTKHAPPALRMRLQRSSAAGRVSAPIRTW